MPHITLDYSTNLETLIDIAELCGHPRRAAISTDVFPMAELRVRAFAVPHVAIADGNPQHGYLDISVRLRGGGDLIAPSRMIT